MPIEDPFFLRTPSEAPLADGSEGISRRDLLARASAAAGALALVPLIGSAGTRTRTASRLAGGSGPAAPPETLPRTFGPGLDAFIRNRMGQAYLPSVGAAVANGQTLEWSKGYGMANRESHVPADADTVYMLASISKTFICAAFMQLWEAGSVDLDADVNNYLPFPVRNPHHPNVPITPRMLLTHTSGIRDRGSIWGTLTNPAPTGYTHGDATITLADFLAGYLDPSGPYYVASQNFYSMVPGSDYHYSNIAADLAAYIVEVVSGQLYSEYAMDNLFTPLAMTETGLHLADISTPDLAMPYRYRWGTGGFAPYFQYGYPDYPCGAVRTSANSLSIWMRCFMNGGIFEGTRILKATTVNEMFRPQVPGTWGQGLIWYYVKQAGRVLIGHNGGDYGVSTQMFFEPATDIGVITLTNRYIGGWTAWYRFLDIQNRLFDIA